MSNNPTDNKVPNILKGFVHRHRYQSIPEPEPEPQALYQSVEALKQDMEILLRQRGHINDSALTVEDYIRLGIDAALEAFNDLLDGVWDDLRFPAQGVNPPGVASDPDVDTSDGTLLFDDGSTEVIMGIAQMPHTWKPQSNIRPHIHWTPISTNTGDVYWQLDYKIAEVGGVFPGSWTTLNVADTAAGTAGTHQVAGFGSISMTNYTRESLVIIWKVSRIGGDAADTHTGDAKFLEFDIHYQSNKLGTVTEFPGA
jgi:hypothetical protein